MKYVALLRGVNIGGRTIKMVDLAASFEAMGLEAVKTVLASGNVLFESDRGEAELGTQIAVGLSETFGYAAKVQVVSLERLAAIAAAHPFGDAGDAASHDYVIFLENGLEQDLVAEPVELDASELVAAGEGVVYWRVAKGLTLGSAFSKLLTRAKYRDFNTNRNLNTVRRLLG